MGGLQFILQGLNSSDFRLQESSAFVLGSAVARYEQQNVLLAKTCLQGKSTHKVTDVIFSLPQLLVFVVYASVFG